jgi:hypothetical protein
MAQEKRGRGQRAGGKRVGVSAASPETWTQEPTPTRRARRQQMQNMQDQQDRETIVLPLVTLPTIPAMPRQSPGAPTSANDYDYGEYEDYRAYAESEYGAYAESEYEKEYGAQDGWGQGEEEPYAAPGRSLARYRSNSQARPLKKQGKRGALEKLDLAKVEKRDLAQVENRPTSVGSPKAARQYNRQSHPFEVLFVPGRNLSRRLPPGVREGVNQAIGRLEIIRKHKMLLVVLTLVAVLTTTLVAVSNTTKVFNYIDDTAWQSLSGQHDPPTPTPLPAPDITSAGHYVAKYGFDYPVSPQSLASDERQRMIFMLPYAYRATAAYDRRYHNSIEPEMIVWWTHAEGIGARINYSNCANEAANSYFIDIGNCNQSSFWQLGYGNQFSVIYVLKNAFTDMYGDPNNAALVQKVGQWVLNFDNQQGTLPKCGGYSCTFPKLTIDQIMSGIDETTGVETADNWWASVLSRDPAINCYMIAQALSFFNHAATLNWVGCYYYEPCWGYESNRLGDILSAWPSLRQAAHM